MIESRGFWRPSPEQVARIDKILESKTTRKRKSYAQKCMTGGFYEPGRKAEGLGCSYSAGTMEDGVYCDAGRGKGGFVMGFVIVNGDRITVFSLPANGCKTSHQAEMQAITFAKYNLIWGDKLIYSDCESACQKFTGVKWIPRTRNRLADGAARFRRNFYDEYDPTVIATLAESRS